MKGFVNVPGVSGPELEALRAQLSNYQSLAPTVTIPSGADLDDYTAVGTYRCSGSTVAATLTNTPITSAGFMLTVFRIYGPASTSTAYFTQIAVTYSGTTYLRYSGSTGVWSAWKQLLFTDTTYAAATSSAAGLMSAADKTKLDGITAGANKYTHPTYTAKASGLYKVTVDGTGHVSAAAAVAKADITGLGIPAQDTTYAAATSSTAGLMSAADKAKLDGMDLDNYQAVAPSVYIPSGADLDDYADPGTYSVSSSTVAATLTNTPTTSIGFMLTTRNVYGTASTATWRLQTALTTGGTTYLRYRNSSGVWSAWKQLLFTDTTYTAMTAATASAAGKTGLVPAPAAGKQTAFLRGDGTWVVPTNTTYAAATASAAGLMSAADKAKLDGITAGAGKTVTGSYVGTGTYGADNPCSLTFESAPKLVIVFDDSNVPNTFSPGSYSKAQIRTTMTSGGYCTYQLSGNSLTWYAVDGYWYGSGSSIDSANAKKQLNSLDAAYYWIAFT